MLTKEQIFAAGDLPVKEYDVPEWGGSIYIRQMSFNEVRKLETEENKAFWESLVVGFACDKYGQAIFAPEDVTRLGDKNPHVLKRIGRDILKFTQQDVDELEKNSESTPDDNSSSS